MYVLGQMIISSLAEGGFNDNQGFHQYHGRRYVRDVTLDIRNLKA